MSIRAKLKKEDGFPYEIIRNTYHGFNRLSLPMPKVICVILWEVVSLLMKAYYWGKSFFWVTPLYRGLCFRVGKNFKAGTFVPYVEGRGKIYLGDNVRFDGKQNIIFGSIKNEIPEIHIGDNTGFGHNVIFDIAGILVIGRQCMIAAGVMLMDYSGHSIVHEKREVGDKPTEKDVRNITIGNNVWIGTGAYILPGAIIGDNCVIAANTMVSRQIPPNSMVYASPAKVIEIRNISNII
jgi:maltose O-acetyltransferase